MQLFDRSGLHPLQSGTRLALGADSAFVHVDFFSKWDYPSEKVAKQQSFEWLERPLNHHLLRVVVALGSIVTREWGTCESSNAVKSKASPHAEIMEEGPRLCLW